MLEVTFDLFLFRKKKKKKVILYSWGVTWSTGAERLN